ncbi:hypothetical protein Nepgr_022167 [Nepenthes gracilis]|uniref:Uncharacterized protein n=1 Tax=Nepenthes gracilis TaxID=150966 RepID=A0AAD3XY43_NEPGR|nr:hypothetical protein Nepgr_022167 [Nepenthes gracilis]
MASTGNPFVGPYADFGAPAIMERPNFPVTSSTGFYASSHGYETVSGVPPPLPVVGTRRCLIDTVVLVSMRRLGYTTVLPICAG